MKAESSFPVATLKAHLALNVRNIDRSVEFYRALFGIEPAKIRPGYAKFDVANPPLNLTLNAMPFQERGALSHLGIQVATSEDVRAINSLWQQRGLATREEQGTVCCYAVQDKAWAQDPDGNGWEVFTVLENSEDAGSGCCIVTETGEIRQAAAEETATACCEPGSGCC